MSHEHLLSVLISASSLLLTGLSYADTTIIQHPLQARLKPASFNVCQANDYNDLLKQIPYENLLTWGGARGGCGQEVAKKYAAATSNDTLKTHANAPLTSTVISPPLPITTTMPTSSDSMPKDKWLAKLKDRIPDLICNGLLDDDSLHKQLTSVHINYDRCVGFIPASIRQCEHQFYTKIPALITEEGAEKWGYKMGECIGKNFAIKHLFSDSRHNSDET
jgi:hypothetical protein